jgi:hypothetical protein
MATAEQMKTLEERLLELNADQASETLMSVTFSDELTAAIEKLIQPVIDKFHETHPFISLGWELKMDMRDSRSLNFGCTYGSMKGHRKCAKKIHNYREMLEKAITGKTTRK